MPPPLTIDIDSLDPAAHRSAPQSAPQYASAGLESRPPRPRPKTGVAQKVRPLPPVPMSPAPMSAPPTSTIHRARSVRPLPSLPSTPSHSEIALSISVTPASPMEKADPLLSSVSRQTPKGALKLLTDPEALSPSPLMSCQWQDSPITPSARQAPSPRTARLQSRDKLRRLLGESVPVPIDPVFPEDPLQSVKYRLLAQIGCAERMMMADTYNVVEFGEDSDDDSEDWSPENATHVPFKALPCPRFSTQVFVEKKGAFCQHKDVSSVLQDLRNL